MAGDSSSSIRELASPALKPLPLGAIRPRGWLRRQLEIQAEGLSGHLDEFWPDVARSRWIGGDAEGWERGPYWLDGVVPLAILLEDERLIAKARRWIDAILERQGEDGWLGERRDTHTFLGEKEMDPWPLFIVFKAFTQWQEATGDSRIIPAMLRAMRRIDLLLDEKPLQSWAKMRWSDLVVSIHWLHDRTGEEWLLGLAAKAQAQGYDWQAHFADFRYQEKQTEWLYENHVVNHAMALKEAAVRFRQSRSATARDSACEQARFEIGILDRYHGQATGVFSGDESLAGRHPSQGTELCAVVEYLYALECLLAAFGEQDFADRLERIAFNALPATFSPDMWAHQYVQQANQAVCRVSEERIYTDNGPDSNLFGLEPNFGCCTANMHQGWPKFAASLWMQSPDGGLTALSYAPCKLTAATADGPVFITVTTDYPFHDKVGLQIRAVRPGARFPIQLRIPAWAEGAAVTVNDEAPEAVLPGTFHTLERSWMKDSVITLTLPMPARATRRYNGAVSIERGPLVYALKIDEEWRAIRGDAPHRDWEVSPSTAWNYALVLDPNRPDASLAFEAGSVGDVPFSPEQAPCRLIGTGVQLNAWQLERNAAAAPPSSPVTSAGPPEEITLIPYGCTNLRITEMPWIAP